MNETTATDTPLSPIENVIDELAKSQHDLSEQVISLSNRLNPVLRLKFADSDEGGVKVLNEVSKDMETHSELVRELSKSIAKTRRTADNIAFLLNNLEV